MLQEKNSHKEGFRQMRFNREGVKGGRVKAGGKRRQLRGDREEVATGREV